ncbi:hypothetical protein HDU67_007496 [Dinochytrium kinnereticum]|nr:hypothetical protein HDU67_007496 [Dinochytrium kinnereticum]
MGNLLSRSSRPDALADPSGSTTTTTTTGNAGGSGNASSRKDRQRQRFSLQQIEPLDLPPPTPLPEDAATVFDPADPHHLHQLLHPYHLQHHHVHSPSQPQQFFGYQKPDERQPSSLPPFSAVSSAPSFRRRDSHSSSVFQSARETFSFSDALPDPETSSGSARPPSVDCHHNDPIVVDEDPSDPEKTEAEQTSAVATHLIDAVATPTTPSTKATTSPTPAPVVTPASPLAVSTPVPEPPPSELQNRGSSAPGEASNGASNPALFYIPAAGTLTGGSLLRSRGSLASRRSSAASIGNDRVHISPLSLTLPKSGTASAAASTPHPNALAATPPSSLFLHTNPSSGPSSSFPPPHHHHHPLANSIVAGDPPNHLQPPRLNLSFFSGPSATLIPDSPMSAGGPKPGAQVATVIATALDPAILPAWLDRLASKGPVQAPAYLERLYRKIEETESQRGSSPVTVGGVNLFSSRASSERGNLRRNRYTDIVPYDRFRVPLKYPSPVMTGNGAMANPPRFSDYINASFLDTTPTRFSATGLPDPYEDRLAGKKYISTQGPLPETVKDFWGMLWDHNVRVIVMLTKEEERGRPKCHRYWPVDDPPRPATRAAHPHGPGEIEVRVVSRRNVCNGEVTLREFEVRRYARQRHGGGGGDGGDGMDTEPEETRAMWHVHYLNWPDHKSSTARTVLEVIDISNSLQALEPSAGPMVVHCSAGCGRTGTFCVIDSVLHQMESGMFIHPASGSPDGGSGLPSSVSAPAFPTPLAVTPGSRYRKRFHLEGSDDPDEVDDPVLACVMRLRERRVAMVQTLEQFAFCYEAVVTRVIDWAVAQRRISWTPVSRPLPRPPGAVTPAPVVAVAPASAGGPLSAMPGPRSAGGWGRGSFPGGAAGGGGGLEPVVEKSPAGNSPGVPPTPLVPPTPGPSGMAFDWDAALKKVADN